MRISCNCNNKIICVCVTLDFIKHIIKYINDFIKEIKIDKNNYNRLEKRIILYKYDGYCVSLFKLKNDKYLTTIEEPGKNIRFFNGKYDCFDFNENNLTGIILLEKDIIV